MKKQAQFIKNKAGVGLSLLLLLINQIAAHAGTYSDKTKWLTTNLDKNGQSKKDPSLVTLKALSAKTDNTRACNSIIVNCADDPAHTIKLRPFMANRKLPSRRDLELALVEQKAKLAEENNARLNGQVSTFVLGEDNASSSFNKSSVIPIKPSLRQNTAQSNNVSRNNYNRQIAKSTQYGFTFMKQAEQHLLSSSRQQISQTNPAIQNSVTNQSLLSNINNMPASADSAFNIPINTTNQQTIPSMSMNLPFEESGPSALSLPNIQTSRPAQVSSADFGTAGAPPFPLNLLPAASLKQLVKGLAAGRTSHSNNGPAAGFGSWHSPTPLSTVQGNHLANLPYAGFQSHLISPNARKRSSSHHLSALPAVTGSPIKSASHRQGRRDSVNQKDSSARNKMLIESQVKVAAYPGYATQSLKLWNFAQ